MGALVIIPARGGSKGIPKKNVRDFCGKPLIAWTIEHALAADCTERVIVSTDCPEIAEISVQYGADVPFMRPEPISGDTASTESALVHCVEWLESSGYSLPSHTVLMQATSPVRRNGSLDRAYKQLQSSGADSLLTVCEFWHFLWRQTEGGMVAGYDHMNRPRRQDILSEDVKLKENGSFYIFDTLGFKRTRNRLFGRIDAFIMDEYESLEIDTLLDWRLCEAAQDFMDELDNES